MAKYIYIAFVLFILFPYLSPQAGYCQPGNWHERNPTSLEGTTWEVIYPYQPQKGIRLFHFARSQFRERTMYGELLFCNFTRWWSTGNWFQIYELSDEGYRFGGWTSGTFDEKTIHGIKRNENHILYWEGKQVDRKTYEFPFKPNETVVISKLLTYVKRPDVFGENLKRGRSIDEILPTEKLEEDEIGGFIFEVLSPDIYKGKLITAHHDGVPASGYATRIAKEGHIYIQKVNKKCIGDESFGICSIYLDLEETNHTDLSEYVAERQALLDQPDEFKQFMEISKLNNLNTERSRKALKEFYFKRKGEIKKRTAYMLTFFPNSDAQEVYDDVLEGTDNWMKWHAIRALGAIKSADSIPKIISIQKNTNNWFLYYVCLEGLRKINSEELSNELKDAVSELRRAKYTKSMNEKLVDSAQLLEQNIDKIIPDVIDIYLSAPPHKDFEPEHKYNTLTILNNVKGTLSDYISRGLRDDDIYIRYKFYQLTKYLHIEYEFKDQISHLEVDPDFSRFKDYTQPHENELDLETKLRPKIPAVPVIKQTIKYLHNGLLGYPAKTQLFIEGKRVALKDNKEDMLFEITKIDGIKQAKSILVLLENVGKILEGVNYVFEGYETTGCKSVRGLHEDRSPITYGKWVPFSPLKQIFRVNRIEHYQELFGLYSANTDKIENSVCYADIDNNGKPDTRFESNGKTAISVNNSWHNVIHKEYKRYILIESETKEVVLEDLKWKIK